MKRTLISVAAIAGLALTLSAAAQSDVGATTPNATQKASEARKTAKRDVAPEPVKGTFDGPTKPRTLKLDPRASAKP